MDSPPPPIPPLSVPLNVVGSDTFGDTTPPPHHHSSLLQNLSPSILVTVTVLAVTVTLSLSLCFILRHLNRRCLRRFSPSSSDASGAPTSIFSSGRRISPEITPPSVVDSLPLFTFSSVNRRSSSSSVADCAVCLSKFEQHDLLRLLPLCCHAFHAECIDTWLRSNLTCPLCRSAIVASESDLAKVLRSSSAAGSDSFRVEIGNISRRGAAPDSVTGESRARSHSRSRSYSVGSFEYFVEEDSEVPFTHAHRRSVSDNKDEQVAVESQAAQPEHEPSLAAEVASGRSWLKDYVDRLSASISSRTASFRSSGRFFTRSSSQRTDTVLTGDYDVEANRMGEEISEMFRWLSGV